MNKEIKKGLHPVASTKTWLENPGRMPRVSGLELLEEPSRYPVFGGTEEFDAELKAAITKLQKACIWAREGDVEMVAAKYQLTFDPKTYDEIYHVALLRHGQKAEAQRTRETVEAYGRMLKGRGTK
jgi:hypothetical protein